MSSPSHPHSAQAAGAGAEFSSSESQRADSAVSFSRPHSRSQGRQGTGAGARSRSCWQRGDPAVSFSGTQPELSTGSPSSPAGTGYVFDTCHSPGGTSSSSQCPHLQNGSANFAHTHSLPSPVQERCDSLLPSDHPRSQHSPTAGAGACENTPEVPTTPSSPPPSYNIRDLEEFKAAFVPAISLLQAMKGNHADLIHRPKDPLKDFIDGIAYLCETEKMGDNVTAVALRQTDEGVVLHLAANTDEHAKYIRAFALRIVKALRSRAVATEEDSLLELSLNFRRHRFGFYTKKAVKILRDNGIKWDKSPPTGIADVHQIIEQYMPITDKGANDLKIDNASLKKGSKKDKAKLKKGWKKDKTKLKRGSKKDKANLKNGSKFILLSRKETAYSTIDSPTLKKRSDFVRACYKFRKHGATKLKTPSTLQMLKNTVLPNEKKRNDDCYRLQHNIYRIGAHVQHIRAIVDGAILFPELRNILNVEFVMQPPQEQTESKKDDKTKKDRSQTPGSILPECPDGAEILKAACNRLGSPGLQLFTQMRNQVELTDGVLNHAASPLIKSFGEWMKPPSKKARRPIHAELLLAHKFTSEGWMFFHDVQFIGVSKPACDTCHRYLTSHPGGFCTPSTHGKIFPSSFPGIANSTSAEAERTTWNRMLYSIEQELVELMAHKMESWRNSRNSQKTSAGGVSYLSSDCGSSVAWSPASSGRSDRWRRLSLASMDSGSTAQSGGTSDGEE